MPRILRARETGPVEVPPQKRSVWICQCGLSQNKPYCDGSHVQVRDELPERLYVYDELTQSKKADVENPKKIEDLLKANSGD